MERYIAFDVETPNENNDRMSAIGVSVIENGIIVDSYYTLINPETYFNPWNSALTGITPEQAERAPMFNQVWERICPLFSNGILAAHNAPFDMRVLAKCLQAYCIDWERYVPYVCTVRIGKKALPNLPDHKLNTICDYWNIPLDHHQAGSDSQACAKILLQYQDCGISVRQFSRIYDLWKMRTLKPNESV